jgi:hypothetical protein
VWRWVTCHVPACGLLPVMCSGGSVSFVYVTNRHPVRFITNDQLPSRVSLFGDTWLQVEGRSPPARHSCCAVPFREQCLVSGVAVRGKGRGLRGHTQHAAPQEVLCRYGSGCGRPVKKP